MPKVSLPMGIELQAVADLSKGPPTDCALLHNLIVQLMPTLAGLNCILKILNVIGALEGFLTAFPNIPSVVSKAGDVVKAIGDMSDCLGMVLGPIPMIETIKDILLLVISYLECFVKAIRSILDFQVGIDLNAAQGNPALLQSLQCASDNAQTSMQQMMMALAPIAPLFKMIQPLIKISQLPIALPDIGALAGASDIKSAVDQLDQMLLQLKQVLQSIP